jgi:hypothetical protein
MAFQQENVLDAGLSGFTADLVDLSLGISAGVLDAESNLYIGDLKKLYFGDEKNYFLALNANKTSVNLFDISGGTLISFKNDGSMSLKVTSGNIDTIAGDITMRSDGLYVKEI